MYGIVELETFVRIADGGGVTAAATALGISPATASHRLARLEGRLGVTLFHRSSRRVALTDEGATFLERVRPVLESLREAELEIGGHGGELRGHLRVTLAPWVLARFVLPRLAAFQAEHPALSIEFLAVDRTVALVEEGQDCAVRVGRLEDSALVARRIADNRRLLCASPAYLEAHGTPRSAAELAAHRWTCLPWQRVWSLAGGAGRARAVTSERTLLVSSSDALTEAALHGLGVAVKSRLAVLDELAAGRLVEVLPGALAEADAPIWAVRAPAVRPSRKVDAFLGFAADCFG